MAILSVADGRGNVRQIQLGRGSLVLGRSSDCDVVLDDGYVSREHVRVVSDTTSSEYFVQDLNSKNGTWLNGEKLGPTARVLGDGDRRALGNNRVTIAFSESDTTLTLGAGLSADLGVDLASREVFINAQRVTPPLSRKEFDILALLWRRRNEACSRDDLAQSGWPERGPGDVSDAEIEQYVRRIRRRIEANGGNPARIVTLRGYGYKLVHP